MLPYFSFFDSTNDCKVCGLKFLNSDYNVRSFYVARLFCQSNRNRDKRRCRHAWRLNIASVIVMRLLYIVISKQRRSCARYSRKRKSASSSDPTKIPRTSTRPPPRRRSYFCLYVTLARNCSAPLTARMHPDISETRGVSFAFRRDGSNLRAAL